LQLTANTWTFDIKVIFGGVNQNPQVRALQKGLDILVAHRSLLDLIGQGHIDITNVEFFVLDEADECLTWASFETLKRCLKLLPKKRQNLLFSATMPKSIAKLAGSFLNNAVMVDVSPKEMTVDRIEQKIMFLRKADKRRLLVQLIKDERVKCGIVFTRTKHGANRWSSNWIRATSQQRPFTETRAKAQNSSISRIQGWFYSNSCGNRYCKQRN